MNRSILTLILALFFLFNMQAQEKEVIDKLVAVIGSEFVLLSDIEEQHSLIEAERGVIPDDARCSIVENLMATKLMLNQAKLDSIEVGEEEVEAQLSARIDQILQYMQGSIEQFEAYYGQTISEVKDQFREDLRNQLLVQRMQGQVMAGVSVTPSEVKDFYERIPFDSLPYFNSEVELREIVYKPKINSIEKENARTKLADIRKRIVEGGEDFAILAERYSDDPGSARPGVGGDLGIQKRGTFVPEFEAAAYNLEEQEISDLVETGFGFHIIQLLKRQGNSIHTRHILIKPEITYEDLDLAELTLDTIKNLIETDSISFLQAVKKYSHEDVPSYNTGGRMVNFKTGNTFFEVGDLEPDVYFVIDTMEIGSISTPFAYKTPTGETYFRIIALQSRTEPHKANLLQDYSKIKLAALEEKKGKFMNQWVQDKIKDTYINLSSNYRSCPNMDIWNLMKTP